MSKAIICLIALLMVGQVMAYPTIVTSEGADHQAFKQFISKIPAKYLENVGWIELLSYEVECENDAMVCFETKSYMGYTDFKLKGSGGCFGKSVVYTYNYDTVYHELGHNFDLCVLNNLYNRTYNEIEKAADDFAYQIKGEVDGNI